MLFSSSHQKLRPELCRLFSLLILFLLIAGTVYAQSSGGSFDLRKHVIANGGDIHSGGSSPAFQIRGTTGQPIVAVSSGNNFVIRSGFWAAVPATTADLIFQDGFDN